MQDGDGVLTTASMWLGVSVESFTCGLCSKTCSPKRYSRSIELFNAGARLHRSCFIALGMLMECDLVLTQLLVEWHKVIVQARTRLLFQKTMMVVRLWNFQGSLLEADRRWGATALNPVRRCWDTWERLNLRALVVLSDSDTEMPALVDSSDSDAGMPGSI